MQIENQTLRHYIELNPQACEFYDYLETKDLKGQTEKAKQFLAENYGLRHTFASRLVMAA